MDTQVIRVTEENIAEAAQKAAALLNDGQLVAIPTETVYGLAAAIGWDEALRQVFAVKGRPQDNPVIVHISSLDMLRVVASEVPQSALTLADAFWPGPLTMILPKSELVSSVITCGMDTVAVRFPAHPVARAVIEAAGVPIAAPSANLSGKPSPTTALHCEQDLSGKVPLILDGGACDVGVESTVISLAGEVPTILRPGIISLEQIRQLLPDAVMSEAVSRVVSDEEQAESPGMKYKHYSPDCDVTIIKGTLEQFAAYTAKEAGPDDYCMCFDGEEEALSLPCVPYGSKADARSQAHNLFAALRHLDYVGAKRVFVRAPEEEGEALAVANRLIRAAGFKVVEL
ncbi:MAG: threonylcarbamoyl-AMP synthase [Oscillospiraceae bacterium]|nr:threonylcarbamoyl-AMP synthase [Oscillospiraceae bacterium]